MAKLSKAPQKIWKIWASFLLLHLEPCINSITLPWSNVTHIRFASQFFKHQFSHHLYLLNNNELTLFKVQTTSRNRFQTIYTNAPYFCDLTFNEQDFIPVNTHLHEKGFSVVGDFPQQNSLCGQHNGGTVPESAPCPQKHFWKHHLPS